MVYQYQVWKDSVRPILSIKWPRPTKIDTKNYDTFLTDIGMRRQWSTNIRFAKTNVDQFWEFKDHGRPILGMKGPCSAKIKYERTLTDQYRVVKELFWPISDMKGSWLTKVDQLWQRKSIVDRYKVHTNHCSSKLLVKKTMVDRYSDLENHVWPTAVDWHQLGTIRTWSSNIRYEQTMIEILGTEGPWLINIR